MNPVLRAFSAKIEDVDQKDRAITAKISTNAIDRYNTCFEVRGCDLKAYNLNPVVLFEHGRDVNRGSLPIGRNIWIRVDKGNTPKLIARTKFKTDDFSQQLYEAYRDGEMSGWSISALPSDFGKPTEQEIRSRPELADVELVFRKFELCEYSAVAVPGNAECLTEDELRSYSRLISRGIPLPASVMEAVGRLPVDDDPVTEDRDIADESRVQVSIPTDIAAAVDPESRQVDPETLDVEERDKPACKDGEKGKEDEKEEEDEKPGDEADGDEDDEPKGNERSVVELPPLTNARTFIEIFHSLRDYEVQHRENVLRKIQEFIDWHSGRV